MRSPVAVALPLAVEPVELVFALLEPAEIEGGGGALSGGGGRMVVRAGMRIVNRGCISTTGEADCDVRLPELIEECVRLLRVEMLLVLTTLAVGDI